MAKYENELNRMNFLMEYKTPSKEQVKSNIEYHANGADGKVYGILREGTKYYIKTTESGKENLSESYEYIGGFNNRRDNEFKSYNDATKHLELKLMSLNEANGKHEDVSTVDFKRGEKTLAMLTEDARKELDRMQEIFENSCCIDKNCICDKESKGKATPENTTKNNAPFDKKVNADMSYAGSKGTVEGATDNKKVNVSDSDLKSTSKKTKNSGSLKDYKDAHDDLEGNGVADQKKNGGKAVKMNESYFDDDEFNDDYVDNDIENDGEEIEPENDMEMSDLNADDFEEEPIQDDFDDEDDLVGNPGEDDNEYDEDLDSLLEELEANLGNATKSTIVGPEKTMDGPKPEGTNGVDGETSPNWKRIEESEDGNVNEPTKQGNEETMKSFQRKGNLPVQSWEKMNESIARITEDVYRKLNVKPINESIEDKIERLVKEEVTRLNVWGKHPKYQKQPMTMPANKEVMRGTADRDFNDDSAKGERPYGQRIGNSAPFNKTVDMLTDQVLSQLKESMRRKR